MTNKEIDDTIKTLTEMIDIYKRKLDIIHKQRRIELVTEYRLQTRINGASLLIEDLKDLKEIKKSEELSETIDMLIKIFVGAGDSYSSWGTKVDMASQVIKETKK